MVVTKGEWTLRKGHKWFLYYRGSLRIEIELENENDINDLFDLLVKVTDVLELKKNNLY